MWSTTTSRATLSTTHSPCSLQHPRRPLLTLFILPFNRPRHPVPATPFPSSPTHPNPVTSRHAVSSTHSPVWSLLALAALPVTCPRLVVLRRSFVRRCCWRGGVAWLRRRSGRRRPLRVACPVRHRARVPAGGAVAHRHHQPGRHRHADHCRHRCTDRGLGNKRIWFVNITHTLSPLAHLLTSCYATTAALIISYCVALGVLLGLNAAQAANMPNVAIYPILTSGIVPVYRLDAFTAAGGQLILSRAALAAIYEGQLTWWNDSRIAATNPTATLPAQRLTVVYHNETVSINKILTIGRTHTHTQTLHTITRWTRAYNSNNTHIQPVRSFLHCLPSCLSCSPTLFSPLPLPTYLHVPLSACPLLHSLPLFPPPTALAKFDANFTRYCTAGVGLPKWPTSSYYASIPAVGPNAVAATVTAHDGTIGYAPLAVALQMNNNMAALSE